MADNIGTVVQGAHSGFYVYWAKHLGIDKEAFYLSERKNTASVSSSDICLDTSTVVGYEEIGSRTGPNFNAVAKSTLLGGAALGLLASSVSNIEEATFVVFLKNKESCTIHLNITWAVEYFRRIFVTKKGAGPNGSNMQQGGIARVSGDPKVLLERAFMFLEDGDWDKADIYCESVLDQNPKCAEAYLGKLMAEVEIRKKEDLSKAKEPLDRSDNYRKVMRFADESLRERLSNAKEVQHNEQLYAEAMACMTAASDEEAYRNAAQKFYSLGSYKDASSRREQCLQRADRIIADRRQREEIKRKENIYSRAEKCMRLGTVEGCNSAIRLYESIPGFRSSAAQISECRRKIEDLEAKEAAQQVAVEKAKKKAKKIAIIAAPIVCVCIVFVIVLNAVIIPNQKYNEAMDLIDSGDYESAYALLEEIGKNDVIATNKYDRAIDLIDSGDYKAAYALLDGLSYRDSEEKLQSMKSQHPQAFLGGADVGDTVTFGTYEQNNNYSDGNENIEWVVIDKQEDKIMVVSKYIIAGQPFNTTNEGHISWENCTLRKWLNNDFLNEAFSDAEKKLITDTTIFSTEYLAHSTTDYSTTDKIFLLSENERNMLSSVDALKGIVTESVVALFSDAANSDVANINPSNFEPLWWLRTTWEDADDPCASVVYRVDYDGWTYAVEENAGVRPAMWISLE